MHEGGTYLAMEGPQFSTLAESRLYQSWGADVIGMTGMPEAKLAREAELPYACLAMVTDYDCWHPGHDAVDVQFTRTDHPVDVHEAGVGTQCGELVLGEDGGVLLRGEVDLGLAEFLF